MEMRDVLMMFALALMMCAAVVAFVPKGGL